MAVVPWMLVVIAIGVGSIIAFQNSNRDSVRNLTDAEEKIEKRIDKLESRIQSDEDDLSKFKGEQRSGLIDLSRVLSDIQKAQPKRPK